MSQARRPQPSSITPARGIVVGGGIGGLAAALGLTRSGWSVTVLEQTPVFWEAGAGLMVTSNGQLGLSRVGIAGKDLEDAGNAVRIREIDSSGGNPLVSLKPVDAIAIHRRSLHALMLDAADDRVELRPGCRVLGVDGGELGGKRASVRWLDHDGESTSEADLVVAADGANSLIRNVVAPGAHYGPSGFAAWRAVADDTSFPSDRWGLWWGPGMEFGVQRISADRVSWHCLFHQRSRDRLARTSRAIAERLSGWSPGLQELVNRTPPLSVFRHDIVDFKGTPRSFSRGRTVLVGDAAHPVLPTLSQGANLAIEDGAALSTALSATGRLDAALQIFDRQRIARTTRVAAAARRMGWWAAGRGSLGGPWARAILLRAGASSLIRGQLADVTRWQ